MFTEIYERDTYKHRDRKENDVVRKKTKKGGKTNSKKKIKDGLIKIKNVR
jgi:hypothetical protein